MSNPSALSISAIRRMSAHPVPQSEPSRKPRSIATSVPLAASLPSSLPLPHALESFVDDSVSSSTCDSMGYEEEADVVCSATARRMTRPYHVPSPPVAIPRRAPTNNAFSYSLPMGDGMPLMMYAAAFGQPHTSSDVVPGKPQADRYRQRVLDYFDEDCVY